MRPQRHIRVAAARGWLFLHARGTRLGGSAAQALTISPVLVDLAPDRRIASITLSNPGDRAISFQVHTLAWTQPDGMDRYEDTDELTVVPPIAEISAGGAQVFRVMTRTPFGSKERAYRLIFEDVTEFSSPTTSAEGTSIGLRVSHNLPVFAAAQGKKSRRSRAWGPARPPFPPCPRAPPVYASTTMAAATCRSSPWPSTARTGTKKSMPGARVLSGSWRQWTFDLPPPSAGAWHATADVAGGTLVFEWPAPAR